MTRLCTTESSLLIAPRIPLPATDMEQRWSPYPDNQSEDRQARYGSTLLHTPQQQPQDRNGSGVRYDAFASSALPSQTASVTPDTLAQPPRLDRQLQADTEGDLPMEDADPFNKQKYEYPIRSNHRSRPTSQYLAQEESSAARRYSPMNLSPSASHSASHTNPPQGNFSSYTPTIQPNRQSPTRPPIYGSQSYQAASRRLYLTFVRKGNNRLRSLTRITIAITYSPLKSQSRRQLLSSAIGHLTIECGLWA